MFIVSKLLSLRKKQNPISGIVYSLETGDCIANGEIDPKTQKLIAERKAKLVKIFTQVIRPDEES